MSGIKGLIVALGLGICGAFFNLVYLKNAFEAREMVTFVGIRQNTSVEKGQALAPDHLTPVGIPKLQVGNLTEFAVPWSAQPTVIGRNVCRALPGASLLLSDDIKTPPAQLNLGNGPDGAKERGMCVPVDSRNFIASLWNPGDDISFLVPRLVGTGGKVPVVPAPTPVTDDNAPGDSPTPTPAQPSPYLATAPTEVLGPFKLLSIGNRLGSTDVIGASRMRTTQENVLTILVAVDAEGKLEPKAQRLWDLLRATNFQQVGILKHPRPAK